MKTHNRISSSSGAAFAATMLAAATSAAPSIAFPSPWCGWVMPPASRRAARSAPSPTSTRQLQRTPTARPIDGVEDRRTLVEGGPATRVQLLLRRAEESFVKLKYTDAARDYEAAEQAAAQRRAVRRSCAARSATSSATCSPATISSGAPVDAARAAERLELGRRQQRGHEAARRQVLRVARVGAGAAAGHRRERAGGRDRLPRSARGRRGAADDAGRRSGHRRHRRRGARLSARAPRAARGRDHARSRS